MRVVRNFLLMILVLGGAAAGGYFYWDEAYRWRPRTMLRHQDEIAKILDASGWVSPSPPSSGSAPGSTPRLYVIAYRACDPCTRFMQNELPALEKAGVDTRVIMVARPDVNGMQESTPNERATVAELWFNHSWALYTKWMDAPVDDWPAQGITPADGNAARSAVVTAGRDMVEKLTPLLSDNGIRFAYPMVIWWTADGKLQGRACNDPRTDRYVSKALGAS